MLRLMVAALAVAGSAAFAQVSSLVNDRPRGPDNDPSRIVCVTETVTGSRLGTRRVCRTRAEWAEHRAQSRSVIERVQYYKPTCGGACGVDPGPGG